MADAIPAKLKSLQLASFAKRAAQLERFRPIVTYWLRFHMVQKIISSGLHSADPECTSYTTDLMEKLEQAKADMPGEDALLDDIAASAYCEQFALQTLGKGDKEMTENTVTAATADTLMAASTFLDVLGVWKKDDPEIASKTKYAKYHALRIIKAIKAGEDPNATNPVREQEQQPPTPPLLDPTDPDVQRINQSTSQPPAPDTYQPYVESAPNTDAQPSPSFSAPKVSPPPNLPTVPSGYTSNAHDDVSPISQPATSRQGSVVSVGGGYFPRTDAPPTFTSDNTAPSLPTAPSIVDDPLTSSLGNPDVAMGSTPQASGVPDPSAFYQNPASPPLVTQPPQASPLNPYASPPQRPQQHFPAPSPQPPQQPYHMPQTIAPSQQYSSAPRQNPSAQLAAPPPQVASSSGTFRDDEESIRQAQKHAKWAISALNFDDAATAVKELRIALQALGAH
ncbi:Vta1 like-domain-containing protein [Boeremia exigua]|uniref:Vta1 like-domain-containing protein n=1 Tax=Boeremia exigua TaxID=749465 RepID=UPI001E8DDC27|nr:Vta1 like-domain-containing protein [Boeremia exigua]KAH6638062.1 Vta1 like-domain-containing protein [Boeremia exigua]